MSKKNSKDHFYCMNPLLSLDANYPKTNRMQSMHAISIFFQSVNFIKIKIDVINPHKIFVKLRCSLCSESCLEQNAVNVSHF